MNTQNVRKSMQSKEKQHSQTPYRDPVGKTIPARQRLPTTPVSSETARLAQEQSLLNSSRVVLLTPDS
jgi:hypothetical protein